jgi:hypothetical protein
VSKGITIRSIQPPPSLKHKRAQAHDNTCSADGDIYNAANSSLITNRKGTSQCTYAPG